MNVNAVIETVVAVCVLIGTLATLLSSLGVLRLPDVYTRAHATTKSTTLGILFILLGAFLYFLFVHQVVNIRLALAVLFVYFTAPVAGHMIIRSAHRSGVPLAEMNIEDQLQRDLDLQKENKKPGEAIG